MLSLRDQSIVYDATRCTRCGTCLSVCKTGALRFDEGRDVFGILVDNEVCTGCNQCVRVCPAGELPEHRLDESDFLTLRRTLLAYSADPAVRFKSTSGGVARSLARAALETGWADAVYCVVSKSESPHAEGAYLTSPADLDRISGSVYCALPVNEHLRKTLGGKPLKRLLYIGTNCQIQAADRFYKGSGVELVKVAILCKQQKTRGYVRWARRRMKQSPGEQTPLRFRGEGWPGKLRSGNASWANYTRPFNMQLWRVPGCRFCPHAFGWGSDLLLADPWKLVDPHSGSPGSTLTLLRTDNALALWKLAAPYLVEERELSAEDARQSIDWASYRKLNQAKIPFFLGREPSRARRFRHALAEKQRAFYEWLLDSFPVPEIVEKVLSRTLLK